MPDQGYQGYRYGRLDRSIGMFGVHTKLTCERLGRRTWKVWETYNHSSGSQVVNTRDITFRSIITGTPYKLVGDLHAKRVRRIHVHH